MRFRRRARHSRLPCPREPGRRRSNYRLEARALQLAAFPRCELREQLVGCFRRDVLLAQRAGEADRLFELRDVFAAVSAGVDVLLEAPAVAPRERTFEVVRDELDELFASEISHRRPDTPRAPHAPSSVLGGGALVDWSPRCPERYEPPRSSSP